jgi:hypothetical protein
MDLSKSPNTIGMLLHLNLKIDLILKDFTGFPKGVQRMSIQFYSTRSLDDVATLIHNYPYPQVVEWFIGEDGLKIPTTKIHRQLSKHLSNLPVTYWLYDLTAWAAFRQSHRRLNQIDSTVGQIDALTINNVRTLTAADFFTWLHRPSRRPWIESILSDPVIYGVSSEYPETGIRLGSILPDPMWERWAHQDTGKAYSSFQYLELFYLIETVHQANPSGTIILVLPNDETKYYQVSRLMADLMTLGLAEISLVFLSFAYGSKPHHRPYSGNNKVITTVTRETLGV